MSDDFPSASSEQKVNIANYFIQSSPTGEVDDVVTDVSKLVGDASALSDEAITNILREYNTEQFVSAQTPAGTPLIFSKYGQVSPNEYLDPKTGKIFSVDHRKRTVVSETDKKQVLDERVEEFRKAIQSSIETYISENYKSGKCAVAVYGADNGAITIVLSAKNVNLANYWTGNWRSVYTLNVSGGATELKGSVKIGVHYFEDGNVQLHSSVEHTANVNASSPDACAAEVKKSINSFETDFQNNLEEMYVKMHTTTFKNMRRFLTVSKQKFIWNAAAHSLAQEVTHK